MKKSSKLISIRIEQDDYDKCFNISLKESKKLNKRVSVSEIIKKYIKEGLKYEKC